MFIGDLPYFIDSLSSPFTIFYGKIRIEVDSLRKCVTFVGN